MASSTSTKKHLFLAAATIAVGVGYGASFYAQDVAVFPHALHIEEGAACADCHDTSADTPTLITSACEDCHDDGTPAYQMPVPSRPLMATFPHLLHTDVGECADCHGGVIAEATPPTATDAVQPLMQQKQCAACHAENGLGEPGACTPCHEAGKATAIPAHHDGDWGTQHGPRIKTGELGAHGGDCSQCHADDFCITCHQSAKPMSHKEHLGDRGAACDDCHVASGTEAPPTVVLEGCAGCHEGDVQTETILAPGRALNFDFPHALHADVAACQDCHAATAADAVPSGAPVMEQAACAACHEENSLSDGPDDCGPCHITDFAAQAPTWHDAPWRSQHGPRMETGSFNSHGLTCETCHGQDSCITCHQERKPMSHTEHLGDRGAECQDCHLAAAQGLPTVSQTYCADCHEGTVQTSILRSPRGRDMAIEAFPHTLHAEALACDACHADTIADRQDPSAPLVTQQQCDDCHSERQVQIAANACGRCHGSDMSRQAPVSHEAVWNRRHGLEAELDPIAAHGDDNCSLCHQSNACTACHMSERPLDHSGLWRARMHGQAAEWDRDRCTTCHETGACVGCHTNTAPLSHLGAWRATHGLAAGSKNDERCMVCHSAGWCADCHDGTR